MTDPYTIWDRSHVNPDGDWIDRADRDEARAERDYLIALEDKRRNTYKLRGGQDNEARTMDNIIGGGTSALPEGAQAGPDANGERD